ncbi:hypothetical protein N802_13225 [Knoellia sinensis KCTC 19936]|uniref:PASTA domain-containing protein n=1 Tax=Knoellia sinensis KCTC 19936 TaxID=1385520 RepID=A0A0A0JEF0_9MICO|nr:hypothetical protein [Knoellia sinensis]KGN34432.1 hypothetical protein N802_13225 [Knoellia sinensis KCTC 19936]
MHFTRWLAVPAAAGLMFSGVSIANAGEVTGSGKPTKAPANTNSICAFSGLEDGEEAGTGFPGPGGAPPQNWGHVQKAQRAAGATVQDLKASGFQPGDSCNGSRGFLAGGGEEP